MALIPLFLFEDIIANTYRPGIDVSMFVVKEENHWIASLV